MLTSHIMRGRLAVALLAIVFVVCSADVFAQGSKVRAHPSTNVNEEREAETRRQATAEGPKRRIASSTSWVAFLKSTFGANVRG